MLLYFVTNVRFKHSNNVDFLKFDYFSHQSEVDICKITSGKKWLISNRRIVTQTFQKPEETQDSSSNDSF